MGITLFRGFAIKLLLLLAFGFSLLVFAKTGVSGSVPADTVVSGYPHMPHRQWLKSSRCFPLLPEMRKTLKQIEERMKQVEELLDKSTGDKK